MGHKTNPKALRINITAPWRSRWFSKRDYVKNLKEDIQIRRAILGKWKKAAISDVEIERSADAIKLIIKTNRPGILIGRGGTGIEDINKFIRSVFFGGKKKPEIKIEIKEIKQFEENASLVAQHVAEQLEKRLPYRRILKSMLEQIGKNKVVKGARIEVAGRLGGAEIARREWLAKGTVPLHTFRADVDFARSTAKTTYGTIGVKVWIYRGEIFEQRN
jgi:small subunit ribosomal protein S3